MNSRNFFKPELVCSSAITVAISPAGEIETEVSTRNTPTSSSRISPSSLLIRIAMKISRARWFSFLRRVFHYQNGLRSEFGTNPFNSIAWMITELIVLVIQITMISSTLAISMKEKPVWPMRIWVSGYGFGCVLGVLQLCFRYRICCVLSRGDASSLPDIERSSTHDDESRVLQRMNKYRSFLELFFAIWFVVGNIWMFDSRLISFRHAPKLYILCIFLLSWNAISYSFPFILFVLLCCIVPLVSSLLGYNMSKGSTDRGALDEQISKLASWKYKEINTTTCSSEMEDSAMNDENPECCICLAKYKDNEEIRQLPCSHVFHLKCVDQWLRIISCCPLCKKQLQRGLYLHHHDFIDTPLQNNLQKADFQVKND